MKMNELLDEYLSIIKYNQLTVPTLSTVESLLKQHLDTFSFSSLAANLGETIIPETTSLAAYLFENKSGLCFHHNNTFYEILKQIGFSVELIGCRFKFPNSTQLYPIPTHAAIMLTTEEGKFLVDAGLGNGIYEVIPIDLNKAEKKSKYQLVRKSSESFELYEKIISSDNLHRSIKLHYQFNCKPVTIEEFQPGINTLTKRDHFSKEGTLIEQGHLFYSMFFFSKLIDGNFKYLIASLDKENEKTLSPHGNFYNQLVTIFDPNSLIKGKLKSGTFVNAPLKKLLFKHYPTS